MPLTPGAAPAWWRYVERARGHEVLAEWRERDGRLRVLETTPGAPEARVEEELRVPKPWEARLALWLLEGRLSQLGEYWRARSTAPGWTRVGRPVGTPLADPRRNEVIDPRAMPLAHHFHGGFGAADQIVAALHAVRSERYVILRARVDTSALDIDKLDVLHREVPLPLARSVLLREQLALAQNGFAQLITRDHYRSAFGARGDHRAARLVADIVERAQEGALARAPPATPAEERFTEFLVKLEDPRLLALHRRFLFADEEDHLLDAGPIEIRKAIALKRAQTEHASQHLLTILEASLLARERMKGGALKGSDAEVRALTRLSYYL